MSSDSSSHHRVNDLLAEYEVWCEETNQTELNEFLNSRSEHVQDDVVEALQMHLDCERMLKDKFAKAGQNQTVTKSGTDERKPVQKIECYKLLKKIGEGGFGIVYMADQTHPVRRRVAIKVAQRKTKPKESKEIIARFRQERQALALMDHENIARIFDAGTAKNGQPYFVMELVKGVPLTNYCDQNRLSISQRLELMITVCQAVLHAHQKGIIHRDLKPSNILVSFQNGKHLPKVIDFGLAKAMGNQLSADSAITQFGARVGTPLYMSPEQAGVDPVDVDTRADVYSLGIILYELLTGITPLQRDSGKGTTAFNLIQRIREEQPPTPSSQLSSSNEAIEEISRQRQTDPAKLLKQVRGDLDCIVMSAIDKDRELRYETTSELADDVARYLNFEPIRKRPPSVSYRVKKFARKNRGLVATGISFVAVLFIALTAVTLFWMKAEASESRLQKSNNEKDTLIEDKDDLIDQGSSVAVARGRDAWKDHRPEDAIAHFVSALRMNPRNKTAARWLYHSIGSHQFQGWHPPHFVIGGQADVLKAVLSQDGKFVALQTGTTVKVVRVVDRETVINSIGVEGVIEDLHVDENLRFRLLTIEDNTKNALVWTLHGETTEKIASINGRFEEGNLQFSNAAKYLVTENESSAIFEIATGRRLIEVKKTDDFELSLDDSLLTVTKDGEFTFQDLIANTELTLDDVPLFQVPNSPTPAGEVIQPASVPDSPTPTPATEEPTVAIVQPATMPSNPTPAQPENNFVTSAGSNNNVGIQSQDKENRLKIVPSSVPRYWISKGRPISTFPGSLTYQLDDSLNQYCTFFNFASATSEITSFRKLSGGCAECAANSSADGGQPNATNIFGPEGRLIRVESDGAPQCSGINCSKQNWGVTYHFGQDIKGHWKRVRFPVYQATFDIDHDRVLLASRPLPSPTLQLFDFAKTEIDPPVLSIPSVEQLPNRLESHFLEGGSMIVTNLAKNAIGIWDVEDRSVNNIFGHAKIDFDLQGRLRLREDSVTNNVPSWNMNTVLDAGGKTRNYREYGGTTQQTKTVPIPTYLPAFHDARPVNGNTVLYIAGEKPVEDSVEPSEQPAPESTSDRYTISIDILDQTSFNVLHTVTAEFLYHTDRAVEHVFIDRSGDFLVVEGQGLVEATPDKNSVLENPSDVTVPAPMLGIYQLSTQEWLEKSWRGKFASFFADSNAIACISDQGAISTFDIRKRKWNESGFTPEFGQKIVNAAIDASGKQIAGVTDAGTLLVWHSNSPATLLTKIPDCGVPFGRVAHPIVFDKTGNYIAIMVDSLEPYYRNSRDCETCTSIPARARIVDWNTGEKYWVENTFETSSRFLVTNNKRGLNLVGIGSKSVEFGPLTFDQGRSFLSADEGLLLTITKPESADTKSQRSKLEVWNTFDESPMAPVVELDAGTQVISCAFSEELVRILCLNEEFVPSVIELPLRKSLFDDDDVMSDAVLEWADSFSGRRVELGTGRVVDVKFSESRRVYVETEIDAGIWRELHDWLVASPKDRPVWPDENSPKAKVVEQSVDEMDSMVSLTDEPPPLIPDRLFQELGPVVAGFEHDWGFLWQHKGDQTIWTQTSKHDNQVHRFEERERTADVIQIVDKKRMLEIELPISSDGANFDKKKSRIRGWAEGDWGEWRDWHSMRMVSILN